MDAKQDKLVSGTNIKTINGTSILGSGNITISGGSASSVTESTVSGWGFTKNTGTYSKPSGGIPATDLASAVQASLSKADTAQDLAEDLSSEVSKLSQDKQDKLVSGTNIKTINNTSILGSGNISISGGSGTITGVSANGTSVATSGVANIPAATTSKYGVTKLSSATNSTSTTLAATSSAVKAAYDLANSYKGTVTSVKINGTSYSPVSGVVDLGTIESGGGSSAYPTVSTTASSISMQPNTYYKKTNVSNLTISLATPTDTSIVNEYIIEFDAFSNISLPTTLAWANNEVPTFKIGATYIISIINNLAMVTEFQKVVNFKFDGTTYQGLGGMTLAEWCNSDYNPGHYEWDGGSIVNNNKQACCMPIIFYIYNGLNMTCNEPW